MLTPDFLAEMQARLRKVMEDHDAGMVGAWHASEDGEDPDDTVEVSATDLRALMVLLDRALARDGRGGHGKA